VTWESKSLKSEEASWIPIQQQQQQQQQSRQDALEWCGYGSDPCATRNGNFDRLSCALMVPCAASS